MLFNPGMSDASTDAYDVSVDGQRFLAITPRATTTEGLTIVQNWPALLKKQAHHRRSAGGISKSRLHGDVTNRRSPNATSLVIW